MTGIFVSFLQSSFNTSFTKSEFSSVLKQANITLVFRKGDKFSKDNYRPVSILPNVSKIFERCMFCQIIRKGFYQDTSMILKRARVCKNLSSPCLKIGNLLQIMKKDLAYFTAFDCLFMSFSLQSCMVMDLAFLH